MGDTHETGDFSVLILDDDPIIAMDLAQQISALGLKVVGPVHSARAAMDHLQAAAPDCAILDFNLKKDRTSAKVASWLLERDIPFSFLSGYSSTDVLAKAGFADARCLSKPVQQDELDKMLGDMLGAR